MSARLPLSQRVEKFWSLVDRRGSQECWEWRGLRTAGGYGTSDFVRRHARSNRVAWELANGRPPGRMFVLHKCDNPACCNPDHLFLGTQTDNMQDMLAKGRAPGQSRTHCYNGHELTEANTYVHGQYRRKCRACNSLAAARYKAKKEQSA